MKLLPLLAAIVLSSAPAPAAYIDSNLAVSSEAHTNGGGCYPIAKYPGFADQLNTINPEWAAIDVGSHTPPEADPITLHGTVAFAKINEEGDFPGDHLTDDQNTFLDVDPADMGFVATGNVGPHGEEGGQLEFELEIGSYPLFAWAGPGDRMTTVGRWIWDCGHQDVDPEGSCSTTTSQACILDSDCAGSACPSCIPGEICVGAVFNYHSELHPPQAVAVSRLGQGHAFSRKRRGGRLATRTDVWITPQGGGAGDRCILLHRDSPLSLAFTVDCFPLSEPLANVNASDFAFDIPLPPRPAGSPGLRRIKVFDQTPHGLPRPKVRARFVGGSPPVVHAVVDMTTPIRGRLPSRVGKTILTGWRRERTPMTRLQVAVTGIEIVNPLKPTQPVVAQKQRCSATTRQDCSASPCPAGEKCLTLGGPVPGWEVFLEANGHWEKLTGLQDVQSSGTLPQSTVYDLALPATGALRLRATGHSLECREVLYGMALSRILSLYGFDDGPACLQAGSHDIGDLDVTFPGPDFGSGSGSMDHVTASVGGDGGACSTTTSQLCLTDADCPGGESCAVSGGAYRLHYTIRRLR